LARELSLQIAADLHISVRHLYRERTAALDVIVSNVAEESSQRPIAKAVPDPLQLQLSLASRLEQNGQWIAASEILEDLSSELHDIPRRCLVESRLADLYTEVGRYTLADRHVARAVELSGSAGPSWLSAEAAISAARLAVATGDLTLGQDVVWRSCMELRSWSPSSRDPRVEEALLSAVNLSSKIAITRGDSDAAAVLTSEALAVAQQMQNPDLGALTEARTFAAMAQIIAGKPDRSEHALWSCYRLAIDGGQIRHALGVALVLAGYLRLIGRPNESIALLNSLIHAVRNVGFGDVLGGFLIELGSAAADVRDEDLARKCLAELGDSARMSPWIHANAELLKAKVEYKNRRFDVALKASEAAESAFVRMGRDRVVGPALQLQAEALAALGEKARAIRTMWLAIERLEVTGQHYRRLLGAYRTIGSLTGDARLKRKASKACAVP
jgi:tetratricopeptide (TPR) repeat protein